MTLPSHAEQHRMLANVDALTAACERLEASIASADTTRRRLRALLPQVLEAPE